MAYWRGNQAVVAALLDTSKERGLKLEAVKNAKVGLHCNHSTSCFIFNFQNGKLPIEVEEEGKNTILL